MFFHQKSESEQLTEQFNNSKTLLTPSEIPHKTYEACGSRLCPLKQEPCASKHFCRKLLICVNGSVILYA